MVAARSSAYSPLCCAVMPIAVMLGDVAVHLGVARARKPDAGMDAPAGLVGLGARHDAEGDFAGAQRRDAGLARQLARNAAAGSRTP